MLDMESNISVLQNIIYFDPFILLFKKRKES